MVWIWFRMHSLPLTKPCSLGLPTVTFRLRLLNLILWQLIVDLFITQQWDRYRHVEVVALCSLIESRHHQCCTVIGQCGDMPHIPLHIQRYYELTPTIWSACEVVTMPSITFQRPHSRHSKVFGSTESGHQSSPRDSIPNIPRALHSIAPHVCISVTLHARACYRK